MDGPENVIDSNIATVGGVLTIAISFSTKLFEWMTSQNVNDVLQIVMALGGIVFLWYKIQGQRLDNEKKRKDLDDE